MSPAACLTKCEELVNDAEYLNVNMYTLQHKHYKNIFGVGDCIGTPNSKTAAAIGISIILSQNCTAYYTISNKIRVTKSTQNRHISKSMILLKNE